MQIKDDPFQLSDTSLSARPEKTTTTRFGFSIGPVGLLDDPRRNAAIVEDPAISILPNTPLWFEGVFVHRGELLPVINLASWFFQQTDVTKTKSNSPYVAAFDSGDGKQHNPGAFVLAEIPTRVEIDPTLPASGKLPDILAEARTAIVEIFAVQGKLWWEMDYNELFAKAGRALRNDMLEILQPTDVENNSFIGNTAKLNSVEPNAVDDAAHVDDSLVTTAESVA